MLYLAPEKCNPEHAATLRCPNCWSQYSLGPHGWYWRDLVDVSDDGEIVETEIQVRRVICRECRRTQALIPTTIVPYRPFSVRLLLLMLLWCLLALLGPLEASEEFHASLATALSVRSDARRVAETLRCAAGSLSEAIAAKAPPAAAWPEGEASRFALRFAGEHGTAPFSRLGLRPLESDDTCNCYYGRLKQHSLIVINGPDPP